MTDLQIEHLQDSGTYSALSHFGHGILTWQIPLLFRTSPGVALLVRGPANWPKDGVYPLEGLVETDWSLMTFTMNWKLTRPGLTVQFDAGEPICMVVPQRLADLESYRPHTCDLEDAADIFEGVQHWAEQRRQFLADLDVPDSEAARRGWQRDYLHGTRPNGSSLDKPRTRLRLHEFED